MIEIEHVWAKRARILDELQSSIPLIFEILLDIFLILRTPKVDVQADLTQHCQLLSQFAVLLKIGVDVSQRQDRKKGRD